MHCLNSYRSKVLKETNQNLLVILDTPEESATHEFRVGVKKLTALYRFFNAICPELDAKQALKPYRLLFKAVGKIRESHIAVGLIEELNGINEEDSRLLLKALNARIRKDHRLFQKRFLTCAPTSIRIPTIQSSNISDRAIRRSEKIVLDGLLSQVTRLDGRLSADKWHNKRIMLKRYRHTMDAFELCPGHKSDEDELKLVKLLEQLLGDWHDRATTVQILCAFPGLQSQAEPVTVILKKQGSLLLGSAKIYLNQYNKLRESR